MTVKSDVQEIARTIQTMDHSQAEVKVLHDLLWRAAWRHRQLLGLSDAELLTIGQGDMQARGGGTDKTPPPT